MSQKTVRLTMAQAVARFLTRQMTVIDGEQGADLRRRLRHLRPWQRRRRRRGAARHQGYAARPTAPRTSRAWPMPRSPLPRRASAAASWPAPPRSAPGALNMVTSAALAHVNRLPVLFLPGDVFANRRPDPVLQQVEGFGDGTISANDCFRPVSRYFDRITRPEQIIPALRRAMQVLTDPADCGPVTLSLCQDVQAEAYDYPEAFFDEKVWSPRRIEPDADELASAIAALKAAEEAGDHRRRRRALFGSQQGARPPSRKSTAFRLSRPRPASPPCRTAIRSTWVRSASPARQPPTSWRKRPTSCSPSARGCRTSPPAPGRCSRTKALKIVGLNVQPFDAGQA